MSQAADLAFRTTGWADTIPPPAPGQKIRQLGEGLRILEQLRAGRLWQRMDGPGRSRMLSAGGQHAGMTWTALPDPGAKTMPDEHWRVGTAERLGILRCPAGIPCGLPMASGNQPGGPWLAE